MHAEEGWHLAQQIEPPRHPGGKGRPRLVGQLRAPAQVYSQHSLSKRASTGLRSYKPLSGRGSAEGSMHGDAPEVGATTAGQRGHDLSHGDADEHGQAADHNPAHAIEVGSAASS